jgi:hypothetical protein
MVADWFGKMAEGWLTFTKMMVVAVIIGFLGTIGGCGILIWHFAVDHNDSAPVQQKSHEEHQVQEKPPHQAHSEAVWF